MRIIKNYKTKLIWGHHSHKLGLENQCSRCLVPSIQPAKGQSFTTFGGFMYSVILEASETPNPTFITWEHMQDSECQNYVSWIYGNQIKVVSGYRLPREPEVSINFLLPNEPYVCLWLCQEPFQSVMCWESVITNILSGLHPVAIAWEMERVQRRTFLMLLTLPRVLNDIHSQLK